MTTQTTLQSLYPLARELEKLTIDLRGLVEGRPPSQQDLQTRPLLDGWTFSFLPAPCLVGAIDQHPMFATRPHIHTSELVLIDPHRQWARTWSRFYRLGKQLPCEMGNA
jgi:hypothetical protein